MSAPTTARDAAVKVLLQDFSELVDKLDKARNEHFELQETQRLCHTELDADLQQLGSLVQGVRSELGKAGDAGRAITAAAQRLENAAAAQRLENAAAAQRLENAAARFEAVPGAGQPRAVGGQPKARQAKQGNAAAVVLSLLLVLALGWGGFAGYLLIDQKQAVQAGKATLKAWPALDAGARRTITAAGAQ